MTKPTAPVHRAAAQRVFGNAVWSIAGSGLPFMAGVFAIPVLIQHLGTQRFGILTLAWAVIGYLGLFDLGLGRAITKFAAEKLTIGKESEIPRILWNALWVLIALGGTAGLCIAASADFLAAHFLHASSPLLAETANAVRIVGVSVPLVTIGVAIRAILEARQSFVGISIIRAGSGFLGFVGPLAVLPFAARIDTTVGTLAFVRVLMVISLWILAKRSCPGIARVHGVSFQEVVVLLKYGGWVTISSVVSPLMVYVDRFVVGSVVSISAVAYYVTPSEMIMRLLIVPMALQTAVFPAFSGLIAARAGVTEVYRRTIQALVAILLPAVLIAFLLAPDLLRLWLGADFAAHSPRVAQILAIAIFINGIAHIPAALLQSSGRPDLCAKIHLIELPIYVTLCYVLVKSYGIEGAAIAWLCRVTLDAALLMFSVQRWTPSWPFRKLVTLAIGSALVGSIAMLAISSTLPARLLYVALAAAASIWWAGRTYFSALRQLRTVR